MKPYLLFFMARSEEVGQATEQAPHTSIMLLFIQQFIKRTQELKNRLTAANHIIWNQFLEEKNRTKCWVIDFFHILYFNISEVSDLQEVFDWCYGFFFNLVINVGFIQMYDRRKAGRVLKKNLSYSTIFGKPQCFVFFIWPTCWLKIVQQKQLIQKEDC